MQSRDCPLCGCETVYSAPQRRWYEADRAAPHWCGPGQPAYTARVRVLHNELALLMRAPVEQPVEAPVPVPVPDAPSQPDKPQRSERMVTLDAD